MEEIYDEKINNKNRIIYLFREVKPINAVYINFIPLSINKQKSDFSFFDFNIFYVILSATFFFFLSPPN